jgi:hypothetical protein
MNWLSVLTAKHIFALVLTRYIRDPINNLYNVGFTAYDLEASIFFWLVTMGVDIGLQFSIPNSFIISTAYFPCPRKV